MNLTRGNPLSRVLVITDHLSPFEINTNSLLSDSAGKLLLSLITKAGFLPNDLLFLNFLPVAPPENDLDNWRSKRKTCPAPGWEHYAGFWMHPTFSQARIKLLESITFCKPALIITLGEAPLFALTGNSAIAKWRGSRLSPLGIEGQLLPTVSPRTCEFDPIGQINLKTDLARAKRIFLGEQTPRVYRHEIAKDLSSVVDRLQWLLNRADAAKDSGFPLNLAGDIETRAGHIACFGVAWSAEDALCIPFITTDDKSPFYWPPFEEARILDLLQKLFHHPAVIWLGQNYLYDCQYFLRRWGFIPLNVRDTMIGQHSLYPTLRKGLDYLSSIYAQDHIYWKDEIKEWDPKIGETQYWLYNCKDACITWEIWPEIESLIHSNGVAEHATFQQDLFHPVLRMMVRGIRLDTHHRAILQKELIQTAFEKQEILDNICGHHLNVNSSAQLIKFFYKDLALPGIRSAVTAGLTTNSGAIASIADKYPILRGLCLLIVELRSINVFLSTFIGSRLDEDNRMRCGFAIAGPITYRFSSSENAFGSGMNLQNIPIIEKKKIKDANYVKLPNIRQLFLPDPGYTYFDMDLDRADLQVVVWEADDSDMRLALSQGLDLHCVNACDLFGIKHIPYEELRESHPNYPNHRASIGEANRQKAKTGVHAVNYGIGTYKLAESLGITRAEAEIFISRWFAAHPGIRAWHVRTEKDALTKGYIENRFGAKFYIFGKPHLPELLGWIPQSTVAKVINTALARIDGLAQAGASSIKLQIQVHDSLAGQFLTQHKEREILNLRECGLVEIPYPTPLTIPVGIKLSTESWGHCKS